jgi:hypothetical protein
MAMASQQAACVRLVVDALLEGRFSKASVVAHMYEALQALIHDPQVHLCLISVALFQCCVLSCGVKCAMLWLNLVI